MRRRDLTLALAAGSLRSPVLAADAEQAAFELASQQGLNAVWVAARRYQRDVDAAICEKFAHDYRVEAVLNKGDLMFDAKAKEALAIAEAIRRGRP